MVIIFVPLYSVNKTFKIKPQQMVNKCKKLEVVYIIKKETLMIFKLSMKYKLCMYLNILSYEFGLS